MCKRLHKGRWTKWVESFNSYRLGYLSKRKAYPKQKFARMASAFCDWNESHKCPTFAGWRKCTMEENGVIWNLINLYFFFNHSVIILLFSFLPYNRDILSKFTYISSITVWDSFQFYIHYVLIALFCIQNFWKW